MKLFLTGGTGFAGNILLDLLPQTVRYSGMTIFVLRHDPREASIRRGQIRNLKVVYGDIANPEDVDKAIEGHTHVIHLTGLISYCNSERKALIRVNERGVESVGFVRLFFRESGGHGCTEYSKSPHQSTNNRQSGANTSLWVLMGDTQRWSGRSINILADEYIPFGCPPLQVFFRAVALT
jgi:hypothetical protein